MAGIRMSGLISNMDTESVVKAMMDAHRLKLTKIENKKTVLEWKQDKWKDLNTKLYKLYQEQTSKLRLTSNYNVNKATSANESVVKVTADKNAATGSHSIAVKQLASTQYVTSSKLGYNGNGKDENGKIITTSTSLTDLGMEEGKIITITAAGGTKEIKVSSTTTLNDYLKACSSVGLKASYDNKQNRIFISSAKSGADQEFSIEVKNYGSENQYLAKSNILSAVNESDKSSVYTALDTIESNMSKLGEVSKRQEFLDAVFSSTPITEKDIDNTSDSDDVKKAKKEILAAATAIINSVEAKAETDAKTTVDDAITKEVADSIKKAITEDHLDEYRTSMDGKEYAVSLPKYDDLVTKATDSIQEEYLNQLKKEMNEESGTELDFTEGTAAYTELMNKYNANIGDYVNSKLSEKTEEYVQAEVDKALASSSMKDFLNKSLNSQTAKNNCIAIAAEYKQNALYGTDGKGGVFADLKTFVKGEASTNDTETLDKIGLGTSFNKVPAADSIIEYNGVELKGSSNSITVNGLTFEAISVSETVTDPVTQKVTYKPTSLTVSKDTQGVYNMVKEFVTQYNSILKDMNTLYYADSAKGYNPLTDEEKEAMSDEQIKLWEDKIKDSSLRRDSTLGGITSAMKNAMASTIELEIDGEKKKYSLSTFGIMTSKDYTEKGLLHIYGDKDDATYSDKNDKLMKAIEEDPDTFIKVMTGITDNLHTALNKKMSKTSLSSALTFYNDKQITDQLTQYKKDISKMESKLEEKEAAYYKQFTAMEKALASLQEQQSALSGLLGTS